MPTPVLWLRFLDAGDGRTGPRLYASHGPEAQELALTDRARWVLAAISLPRELVPHAASDERQRLRLGSRLWSSGEITARIPYQHRSTIRHGLNDLRRRLDEHELVLEDYLVVDTDRGCYGIRPGQLRVDLVELHGAIGDPDAIDRQLDEALGVRGQARLAPVCAHLLADAVLHELDEAVRASAERAQIVGGPETAGGAPEPPALTEPAGARAPRRRPLLVPTLVAVIVVLAATVLVPKLASGSHHVHIHPLGPPRYEVSGGVAHTWSNPQLAGGRAGPEIMGGESVLIACRLRGFKVQDGNVWWYLIDSRPWSRRYFVTADAFYNNGHTHGSLRGSAFVDRRASRCS